MNIENVIALIAAVGGLAGLISALATVVFKILDYHKAQKGESLDNKLDEKLQPILQSQQELLRENQQLCADMKEVRLDTTRLQLLDLMHNEPTNVDTILKIAEFYFCTLGGDWYCTSLFRKWTKEYNVEVPDVIHHATKHHE